MFAKRVFLVALIAALAAMPLWAGRVPAASGQDQPKITVSLTPYEGNPILGSEGAQAWESDGAGNPSVVYDGSVFHMFYQGFSEGRGYVGYATSEDGLTWSRYENNPVFVPDVSVAPAGGVYDMKVFLGGDTWVMLFNPALQETYDLAETTLRATAPSPTGPWTVDPEPVLTAGGILDWDSNGLIIQSVLRTDEGYVLYYSPEGSLGDIGMATSPDGIHWTKYDDPATTDSRRAASDPVFTATGDPDVWDAFYVGDPVVRRSEEGWEMFYAGAHQTFHASVGYATSEDGITWTRIGDTPVLSKEEILLMPASLVVVDGTYYLYYDYVVDNVAYFGVATGTVTRE